MSACCKNRNKSKVLTLWADFFKIGKSKCLAKNSYFKKKNLVTETALKLYWLDYFSCETFFLFCSALLFPVVKDMCICWKMLLRNKKI